MQLITARKELHEALRPALHAGRTITRCIRRRGVWIVYAM